MQSHLWLYRSLNIVVGLAFYRPLLAVEWNDAGLLKSGHSSFWHCRIHSPAIPALDFCLSFLSDPHFRQLVDSSRPACKFRVSNITQRCSLSDRASSDSSDEDEVLVESASLESNPLSTTFGLLSSRISELIIFLLLVEGVEIAAVFSSSRLFNGGEYHEPLSLSASEPFFFSQKFPFAFFFRDRPSAFWTQGLLFRFLFFPLSIKNYTRTSQQRTSDGSNAMLTFVVMLCWKPLSRAKFPGGPAVLTAQHL